MSESFHRNDKDMAMIANFCLMDDVYMQKFFEGDLTTTQLVINVIIDRPEICVERVTTQANIKNLQGRSMRLDILAVDQNDNPINIEIQRDDDGATPKRARYHSSVLDANSLLAGEGFDKLPETYVIFITENDVLGLGQPIYHIERVIIGSNRLFNDCAHIIYVNGKCQDDTPLGRLMHDFFCPNPDNMHYKELADRARYFKCDERGVTDMYSISEQLRSEGRKAANTETALRMLAMGKFSHEEIAMIAGLTLDEVNELAGQRSA